MPDDSTARVRAALDTLGFRGRCIDALSSSGSGRKRQRRTWRVTLADGTLVKVRQLEDIAAANALLAARRDLPGFFAPVIAAHDELLVEAWIDGQTLTDEEASGRAHELGAMMGALHQQSAQPGTRVVVERQQAQAFDHLDALARRGLLSAAATTALTGLLNAEKVDDRQAIVHLDFAAENIVRAADDRLHVIDNEWLRSGAPGADIGRCYARWAASDAGWSRFLEGYRSAGGSPSAASMFWLVAMSAASVMIRIDDPLERVQRPLARLTRLAIA